MRACGLIAFTLPSLRSSCHRRSPSILRRMGVHGESATTVPQPPRDNGERYTRQRKDDGDRAPESWVPPKDPLGIRGPTPLCVTYDSTRRKVVLHSMIKGDDDEETSPLDRTPTEVSQVWVTTRVAGSPTINLRTGVGEGKFLSCDKLLLIEELEGYKRSGRRLSCPAGWLLP